MEEKGDPESQNYMVSTIQPFDGTPRFQTVLQFLPRHPCSCISGHRGLCVVGVIIHSIGEGVGTLSEGVFKASGSTFTFKMP